MASSTVPVATSAAPRRRRRLMVVPLARKAAAAPAPDAGPPPIHIGTPRSAFWQNNFDMLAIGSAQVEQLKKLTSSIGAPTGLAVTTQFEDADFGLIERGVLAMEALADAAAAQTPGGGCEGLEDISDAAFELIARVVDLAVALFDRTAATPRTVTEKLRKEFTARGESLAKDLREAGVPDAVAQKAAEAFVPAPFDDWAAQGDTYDHAAFRAELRRRVLLLLALKCWIAQHVHDAPPPPIPVRGGKRAR